MTTKVTSSKHSSDVEYMRLVGSLVGDMFEDEVCDRLRGVFSDFQRIPRKPSGDAGLDGMSHDQSRAYCCYGPEQDPVKLAAKGGLKDDILEKFRGDLRKLFELEFGIKRKLIRGPCGALDTVMAKGAQLKTICLVVSWFEDKRILGALNTSVRQYRAASACSFVAPDASLVVWGPKDLAGLALVDDLAKFRAENRSLVSSINKIQSSSPQPVPASTVKDFDAKFDWLISAQPAVAVQANNLRERFRKAWGKSLLLDEQLETTAVRLHEALQGAREQAAISAELRSMQGAHPANLIQEARADIARHLESAFKDGGAVSEALVDGEVARLVGECPLEWRR